MAATKKKKTESTNLEERVKKLEDVAHVPQNFKVRCEEVERKVEALFQGLKELEAHVDKIRERMGI